MDGQQIRRAVDPLGRVTLSTGTLTSVAILFKHKQHQRNACLDFYLHRILVLVGIAVM